MLIARFFTIVAFLSLFACSSEPSDNEIESVSNEFNSRPPPPVECNGYQLACGGKCVEYTRDINNCGWCGVRCNVRYGEICLRGDCVIYQPIPDKWRPYDVRKDLGRPAY